ncbi:hypothetical protein [Undibacterium luofuense]|uniref:hypothetical protein n=1 Tax=Undibacterium luofuense TaxID=2828733 RepID=UPI0030EF984F
MTGTGLHIAVVDNRPFFETALRHGLQRAILTSARMETLGTEAAKGIVQIADAFGSKYLRPELELARKRIVNLVSLYLRDASEGDVDTAARLIRDNTFLTLSRGGSGLLKALFAMPEFPMFGEVAKGKVEDFLDAWSLKEDYDAYLKALAYRRQNQEELDAAVWFAGYLGLGAADLKEEHVEAASVVRTALLLIAFGDNETELQNQVDFARMAESVRKLTAAKRLQALEQIDLSEVPEKWLPVAERVRAEIIAQDVPVFADKKQSLDRLVFTLKDRYFLRDIEIEDTSAYDALVSKEWTRITQGKTDVDSLMTLFLCIAAGVTPKTELPVKTAKALVKQFREQGFAHEKAVTWIRQHAPHEKQEGLLEDWQIFVEEAENYMMDEWDDTFTGALRFLAMHCHIQQNR